MKTKNCKNCNFFKVVYREFGYRLSYSLAYPMYYCTKCEQMTDKESICENRQAKKAEYDISPQRLKEVEQDIKYLLKLFN